MRGGLVGAEMVSVITNQLRVSNNESKPLFRRAYQFLLSSHFHSFHDSVDKPLLIEGFRSPLLANLITLTEVLLVLVKKSNEGHDGGGFDRVSPGVT